VRAALALMLCFAAVAVLLNVEQILATFIAGMICSFGFRGRNALTEKLMTLGQGFFLPIFFITAGLGLDARSLLHGAALVLLLALVGCLAITRLAAVPLLRLAGLSWSDAGIGALLLAAPLTLQVAIVKVGIDLGDLPSNVQGVVLGAAILGAFVFPLAARALRRVASARRPSQATVLRFPASSQPAGGVHLPPAILALPASLVEQDPASA
jgi:Kef-type K+ transport system membrane component KefB